MPLLIHLLLLLLHLRERCCLVKQCACNSNLRLIRLLWYEPRLQLRYRLLPLL
jgi:hypothetical protein